MLWIDNAPVSMMRSIHHLKGRKSEVIKERLKPGPKSTNSAGIKQTQQTLLYLRAQPIRLGRQERQAPLGQNARVWGRLSIAITPDAPRAECLCLATPQ
ncbi:hypothetical protein DFP73DRAFT_601234 [Morchella snyderi]|nr:hypothetical protein DFP73DRAFT_601234 [Morchella snyderi]